MSKCISNFIKYTKPDIYYQDKVSKRTFLSYIIRHKNLSQKSKIKIASICYLIYENVDFFFISDAYKYTPFHHALVMDHYKLALQIMLICKGHSSKFEIPERLTSGEDQGPIDFYSHPLTFFLLKN